MVRSSKDVCPVWYRAKSSISFFRRETPTGSLGLGAFGSQTTHSKFDDERKSIRRNRRRITKMISLPFALWIYFIVLGIECASSFQPDNPHNRHHPIEFDRPKTTTSHNRLLESIAVQYGATRSSRTISPHATKEQRRVVLQSSTNLGGGRTTSDSVHQPDIDKSSDNALSSSCSSSSSSSSSWIVCLLFPLWLVYVSNQWSRCSLPYLVDFSSSADPFHAMNVDLNFSQSQYGVLASVAFTALFAVFSLVAGAASDRYDRKFLTTVSAASWSIATLGTSLSHSYDEVLLWRIAMGLACAFTTPTAYTLLQQHVPKDKSALASSLYGSGVLLGGGLASLTLLLDSSYGWSNALVAIAVFGFISVAVASCCLPSDSREKEVSAAKTIAELTVTEEGESSSFSHEAIEVISTPRVRWLFLGSILRFCSGMCVAVWSAPYFRLAFADHLSDYAYDQACITAICGIASSVLGGLLADRIASRATNPDKDGIGRTLWVPVLGSLLATPAWFLAVNSASFEASMAWLAVEYLAAECWFGPTVNVLQSTVHKKVEGTAQGLFAFTGAIGNLAPTTLGFFLSSTGHETPSELSGLLSIAVCSGYISSAVCFAMSAKSAPEYATIDENIAEGNVI